jgi:formylglycine-generating enzyme required for sulfatase activity
VKVVTSEGSYCIDSTEVTNAQYAEFLSALASSSVVPTLGHGCPAMTNFTPVDPMAADPVWPTSAVQYPVVHVNWCDAYAYCAWAGKRLCGAIGGGSLMAQASPIPQSLDTVYQWLDACSMGGATAYPYGGTYQAGSCNGGSTTGISLAPVASSPQCVGGYPGLYDMSGNAWEWIDACTSGDITAFCSTFGGAYDSGQGEMACLNQRWWTRTSTAADIGFRCCQDL